MKSHGLQMIGKFNGEKVPTLPVWLAADEGRDIYVEDEDKKYYGTDSKWVEYINFDTMQTAISNLVDSSPATLDTLNELAAALGDDPNFATTVSTNIGTKLAKASNLSDLVNKTTARTNLGVDIAGTVNSHTHPWSQVTSQPDPTLTLSGDASGSCTFTNLGNATLSVAIINNSHYHDGTNITTGTINDARLPATISSNITGNAASATKLITARTINGVSFNGTANITVEPYISGDDTGDTNCPIVFTATTTAGYKRLYEDSGFWFNNTSNILYTNQFIASTSITSPSYNTSSLRSLKENIQPFNQSALDIIDNVDIVSYNLKADEEKHYRVGFIADDTDPILSGKKQDHMNLNNILSIAVKAIQELKREIIELKANQLAGV
jgi:hypothetical protein